MPTPLSCTAPFPDWNRVLDPANCSSGPRQTRLAETCWLPGVVLALGARETCWLPGVVLALGARIPRTTLSRCLAARDSHYSLLVYCTHVEVCPHRVTGTETV